MKISQVFPVCKNGVRADPGNHGPVNLTSVPRKIMVKNILGTTERHLKKDSVIRHGQQRKSPFELI